MKRAIFTCGDINGIGPEIVIKTLNNLSTRKSAYHYVFVTPKNIFLNTAKKNPISFEYSIVKKLPNSWDKSIIQILDIGNVKQKIGKSTKESGAASFNAIQHACELAKTYPQCVIITAPISKLAFSLANINFPGHTELFADYFNIKNFSMMFVSKQMKAGLITIHIPLYKVSKALSQNKIIETISVIYNSLKYDFAIENPKIAMLGLNPHAGENGNIGSEEEKILKPLINSMRYKVEGPFVPDAYFGNKLFKSYDCTIGMYHDQILIPFKLINFNKGVNFTAGLPIIRTSPDHGTAFDIAGKGIANPSSMINAFNFAKLINKNRSKYL